MSSELSTSTMSSELSTVERPQVGFACAYTPLSLIHAAGFSPYRILPLGQAPDQAGTYLHDNLCPHVKRILDRALADDLPPLAGVVLMSSCDAMRRLADAWRVVRPRDRLILVDLPITVDETAVVYLARELNRLADQLALWAGRPGRPIASEAILGSNRLYNDLARRLAGLRASCPTRSGGWRAYQELVNRAVTEPVERLLAEIDRPSHTSRPSHDQDETAGSEEVPLFLFGNMLADPQALDLLQSWGGSLVGDDLCTSSRLLTPLQLDASSGDLIPQLARGLLARPLCARTLHVTDHDRLADQVVMAARACGARGVIAHLMKFCDPYLARVPALRKRLREAGLPLLVLEGDCTLRSLGQHRTRIEAFVEMLGDRP